MNYVPHSLFNEGKGTDKAKIESKDRITQQTECLSTININY